MYKVSNCFILIYASKWSTGHRFVFSCRAVLFARVYDHSHAIWAYTLLLEKSEVKLVYAKFMYYGRMTIRKLVFDKVFIYFY